MKSKTLQIFLILFSLVLTMCGNSAFTTFFSIFIQKHTQSSVWVGLIQATFFAGYIIGAYYAHNLVAKWSHRKSYILITLLFSATQLVIFATPWIYGWLILRFFSGFLISIIYVILESSLLITSSRKKQGSTFSLFMIGLYLSQSAGQFIFNWVEHIEYLAIALPLLSIFPLLFLTLKHTEAHTCTKIKLFTFFKRFPSEMLLCALAGSLVGIFFIYCPLLLNEHSYPVGKVMGVTLLGALFFQFPVGSLADKINKQSVIRMIALLLFVSLIFLSTKYLIYPLVFIGGGALFSFYPLVLSKLATHFDESEYTSLCAKVLLTYSIGSIIGPLICAISVPIYIAMIGISTLSLCLVLRPVRNPLSVR